MFLYLADSLDDDFSNYNDNEAWPSLFDDFVDYEKEIRGNQVGTSPRLPGRFQTCFRFKLVYLVLYRVLSRLFNQRQRATC